MSTSLKILGIYRETKYSNRAVQADKAIMDEVLKSLICILGDRVTITKIYPDEISNTVMENYYHLIFSMAQGEKTLNLLEILESRGSLVINSSKSIRNCFRGKMSELLSDTSFSYPQFITLKVDQLLFYAFDSSDGYWVKRGDFHALMDEDVMHIKTINELAPVLANLKNRGVMEVILQKSLVGELFKFYGIRDNFFNLRYMGRTSNDRYTFVSGNPDIVFDRGHLEKLVYKAARVLDLDYFGGDCIITDTGSIHFIDFNDWPSFRTCLKIVAPKMAMYALKKLKNEVRCADSFVQ